MGLDKETLYAMANVKQHAELEAYLRKLIFDKEQREEFYKKLIKHNSDVSIDSFKAYFEEYAAERKSNQQDYTPTEVCNLLAIFTKDDAKNMTASDFTAYDPTAGTGGLLISKWWDDCIQMSPFTYRPHNYFYLAEELADNAIPYLLHNLALRGMNAVVIHGDTLERSAKQAYFIQNQRDDALAFSDINVLPHTNEIARFLNIKEWTEEAIDHIESKGMPYRKEVAKMPHQKVPCGWNKNGQNVKSHRPYAVLLKDIATVERAKSKKEYPRGTIVIQMSATRGQVGMLTSPGQIASHYAAITLKGNVKKSDAHYFMLLIKERSKHHFHRVQEGLNLTLDNIETIPLYWPFGKGTGITKEILERELWKQYNPFRK